MPKHKRRSYGWIDPDDYEDENIEEQGAKPIEKHPKTQQGLQVPKARQVNPPTAWINILTFPFKLAIWILKTMFRILGWLWSKKPKVDKRKARSFRQGLLKNGVLICVGLGVILVIYTLWISRDLPDPDRLTDRKVAQSTKIYDRTGEHLLYEIFADEKRTIVELEEIPKQLINAVIATEDKKFYEHHGVRPESILRAFVYGLLPGKRVGGTSTLTQQLVKNAILTNERKINRKLKEIILSLRLEQKYTKEQILKIYFNEIPYGSTNYGAQAAAQSYFGKNVSDLNLQEIATLAGLPQSPSTYLADKKALKQRRDFVLRRMFEEGYITQEEKETAQAEELTLELHFNDIRAPHFVLYVRQQLIEEYGEQVVDTGGLKVITTLDWDKQQAAEKAVEEVGSEKLEEAGANNTSLVAIDPKNGHILALVGSKNFNDEEIDGQFNVATLGKRQPGSSFKPIIYTAAFEKGYTPDTVLFDVVTNFNAGGNKPYAPLNYNLKELGPVTMRQALQGSLNIPAVKTLYLVGVKNAEKFGKRLGYTTLDDVDAGLSLVLGGGSIKLLDHVSAYGVLANDGVRHEPVSILKVEDPNGDVLQEWKQEKGERVIDSDITATISNVLSDDLARAFAFGAGGVLTLPGRPVAAKTGTTNSYVDAWTVGYTPSLAAGVWAGNTDNSPMKRGYGGSKVAAPIWKAFMIEALKDAPAEGFPEPPPNDAEKPVLRGSQGGSITLQIDKVTNKLATSSTPEHYIAERTYLQPHSILHYVIKDDPRGDYPKNPEDDPQYSAWEAAIQDWINRKKEEEPDWEVSFEEPPTEYDDAHSIELIPTLEVIYPTSSSTLTSRQIDTDIRVSAKRGVSKVTYKIDEKYVGVVKQHPFNLNYYAADLESGKHTLTVIVEDDIGNRLEKAVPFILNVGQVIPSVLWVGGDKKASAGSQITLFLNHVRLDKIKEIRFYQQPYDGDKEFLENISDFSNLFNNQIMLTWVAPGKGNWQIFAEVILEDSGVGQGDVLEIVVE